MDSAIIGVGVMLGLCCVCIVGAGIYYYRSKKALTTKGSTAFPDKEMGYDANEILKQRMAAEVVPEGLESDSEVGGNATENKSMKSEQNTIYDANSKHNALD
jgi:hypothetical protein